MDIDVEDIDVEDIAMEDDVLFESIFKLQKPHFYSRCMTTSKACNYLEGRVHTTLSSYNGEVYFRSPNSN